MTLEQLVSPKVTEWIDNYNRRLNEGKVNQSDDEFFADFEDWFNKNEKEINESVKTGQRLNESKDDDGVFSDLFDEEDIEEESPFEEDPEDEKTTEEDETEIVSHDPRAKHKVDNSKNSKRNVFNVVNILYEKICKEGKNMDKVTYLKFLETSDVHDMTALLAFTNLPNADLSSWNTSGVSHMEGMFYKSTFNNDSICDWNVSSCGDFKNMFLGSKFNQSLSKWKPKMIKKKEVIYDDETGERRVEEVEKRASLPFVGAYEDEEKEMDAAFWDEKFKDGIKEGRKSKYTHLMDFETFMINEGLLDKAKKFIKKGVDKVKEIFNSVALKINDFFISFVDERGEEIPAVNPYTTLNYISTGDVSGVTAYSPIKNNLLNDKIRENAEILPDRGYYGNITKDNVEFENFKTFVQMINESSNKGVFDDILNEARVGFSAESGGIKGIRDIDSNKLKRYIRYQMLTTPGDKGKDASKPILIWGAPGVGKSTIPNAIIQEYNESKSSSAEKKALIVAECGDMTADGFALPMPNRMSMSEYISSRPQAKKWAEESGISEKELEDSIVVRSSDAPKMWLPCYKPDPDKRINELRKMVANGHVIEYYDKDNNYQIEETCDGGIIMFDEFFRAEPSIFKILMQILLNRGYGEYKLGDKWGIIACSNRPNDDEEVAQSFEHTGAVVTTRFADQYNFVPDFRDWKKWAEKEGHFDELTLSFLVDRKDDKGEYINWHNIDVDAHAEGSVGHPTPRSWAALMNKLHNICDIDGYDNISQIPEDELRDHAAGAIGQETGDRYVDWILMKKDTTLNIRNMFEDTSYVIPDPIPSAAEMSEKVFNFVETNYSSEDLPKEEYLLNMFNLINKTYPTTRDNYFKQMHINIIKFLGSDKEAIKQIKDYSKECIKRYGIQPSDLK